VTAALPLALAISGVLLWAGAEKLRARADFTRTLAALGLSPGPRRVLAVLVPAAEVAVGCGLLAAPSSPPFRLGPALLGLVFAAGGCLALRSDAPVPCSCLGVTGDAVLGGRQLMMLPVWLGASWALFLLDPRWSFSEGAQWLAGLIGLLGVVRSVGVIAMWRDAMGTRQAMDEAIIVRQPIVTPSEPERADVA
jgi:hypothetical protein